MDVEDEPNSYLKYLSDSETPNTYLLGNNEVGLFSVEPIFTEMEASDWPQEGFPMLLTNPLITEDSSEANPSSSEENCNLVTNNLKDGNAVNIDHTLESLYLQDAYVNNTPVVNDIPEELTEILLAEKDKNNDIKTIQLLNTDGSIISMDKSVLKSINIPVPKKDFSSQQKPKTINDLFNTVIANKCKICSFLCENLEQIKEHIRQKHPEFTCALNRNSNKGTSLLLLNNKKNGSVSDEVRKEYTVYVCSVCNDVCTNKSDLKEHMIQAHDLTSEISQENLEKSTPSKKSTKLNKQLTHILIKKQERMLQKVKCTIPGCSAGFPSEEIRENHERLHMEKKGYFKCSSCEETFALWRIARTHMWKEHGVDFGMASCSMCNNFKSYNSVRILKHMAVHTDEKPFVCSECGKSYKQLSQLKNHEVLHKAPEDMPPWCKIKKCDICESYFANSKCLKKHVQSIHENFKPFICNICGHKTTRKAMLELHLRQHTGAKPHKCEYCEYKTGDPNCLRRHIMKHMGAHQYKCPHCTYACIQSSSLKSHLANKHPGKSGSFTCQHCPYTTINQWFLIAHEKRHKISDKNSSKENSTSTVNKKKETEIDDETQSCFLSTESQMDDTVDKGGITIPAGLEMQLVS